MRKLLILILLIPFLGIGQQKGVEFVHNSSWQKVKEKAKTENKFIFVDCFTTWCGPCKYMSDNVFPQEKVGEFFNANFVNLKIQMDQTDKDSEDVKSWYEESKRFAKDYSVAAYPTFLIFNPAGELVHRIVGGGEADAFIAKAKEGLNPETQYVTLLKAFEANPKDNVITKKLISAAQKAYDEKTANLAIEAYINNTNKEELLKKENINIILNGARSSKSVAYQFIRDNKSAVEALMEDKKVRADDILASVLMNEYFVPKLRNGDDIDFDQLKSDIVKDHPYVDMTNMLARGKVSYYMNKKNWPLFKDAVNTYLKLTTGNQPQELNSYAWTIFENCDDPACLEAALAWSKRSLEKDENAAYLDTYANLLYKTGDKVNAIKWQEKAIAKVDAAEKGEYEATLKKMKDGVPTW